MKRIVLIIGALLLGFVLRAQSVTYTCRYWFDKNQEQAVTATFSDSTWQAELDVGSLSEGLHTLHLHVMDTSMQWGAPQSFLFLKTSSTQPANLSHRYWFDQNHTQLQNGTLGEGTLLLDTDGLNAGLHTLHIMLKDSEYTASQSFLFLKTEPMEQGTAGLVYHCWFDQDIEHKQSNSLDEGNILLDVADLEDGMHTVNLALEGSALSASQSYIFMKIATLTVDTADMSHLVYHCWFDQDLEHQQTDSIGDGHVLLDVNNLEDGLHTVNVMLEGGSGTLTTTQSYMFMKMNVQDPSVAMQYRCWFDQDYSTLQTGSLGTGVFELEAGELTDGLHVVNVMLIDESGTLSTSQSYMFVKMALQDPSVAMQYRCWFDEDYSTLQTGSLGTGVFELEVDELTDGIHTVFVQLDNGAFNTPNCYMFYKRPVGGYITKWEYWLNDDFDNRIITELSPRTDTLEIISLLTVGHPALRSSCFHFHPSGEEPYLNAKNELTLRIWNTEEYYKDLTAFYIDEQVQQEIVAQVFERNTTETFAAPRDNQITWYKLDAVVGDSLSFVASKACTMQLFSPSGEEVFNVSGPESITLRGLHAWEDGTYYLAVHDMTGSGETVSVTYNWVYRYAILAYDVHHVGNGGCSTITFNGNGYNSLLDVYLVNAQNDTIRRIDIGHESNSTTTVTFNFYEENLGVYDAVFHFYDEDIRINGALEVQEPTPIILTNSVSYPHSFMSGRPVTYTYTITNRGNMTAYGIPIYVFISTLSSGNVTHVKIDGLNLPSLLDGMDLDSLSEAEISELKAFSDDYGDLHHFFALNSIDEQSGQPINVLSSFFFMNVAPYESKTINIVVTEKTGSHKPLKVWMTVPNDTIQPLILTERGIRDQYCCVKDQMECVLNITADVSGLLSNIPGAWGSIFHVTNCISASLSTLSSSIGYWVCREEGDPLPFDLNSMAGNTNSYVSLIMDCFKKLLPTEAFNQLKSILDGKGFAGLRTVFGIVQDINDCVTAFTQTKPGCPPGDEEGGTSDEVTPGDPNDIYGYLSESGSHYMRQEIQNVQYEIEFENDTTLATAAAHTIIVRDTLNRSRFDLNSLAARSVTIGDKRLDLNGEQTFARTLDLRPELYVIAQIEQDYNPTTGIIQWTIQSLDPMTMEPTDDPNQGVLPVNYNGNGVGFIDYSVNLKQAFADGTKIKNRAGIIFDQEEVIMTPIWTNTVDAVKPTSYIEEVTQVADSLNFQFVSSDNRSGVWYHTLYYRNDSTEMQWQVRKPQVFGNCLMLPIDSLLTTEYLVIAVDSAGNHEEKEMVAEYTYYSSIPTTVTQTNALSRGWNWYSTYIEQEGIDGLGQLENSIGIPSALIQSKDSGQVKSGLRNGRVVWRGDLSSINNEEMYKIGTKRACNATMEGQVTDPASHPITINKGWNWIGFPCSQSVSVSEALSRFRPKNNDVIKGIHSYATFRNGTWQGTLNTLEPGQGYMYGSRNNATKTLVFQTGRGEATLANITPENNFYQPTDDYADNMTLIAVVDLEGEELRSDDYELAAFVGDECRGSVKLMYVAPIDRYVAFLTIFGELEEELRFVLTDGMNTNQSVDQLTFAVDNIAGSLDEPVVLRFGATGVDENASANVRIYPNPSEGIFNIEGNGIRKVEVFNALGQPVYSMETENGLLKLDLTNRASGIYLIRVITDDGICNRQVMKR